MTPASLDIARLSAAYHSGDLTPTQLIDVLLARIEATHDHAIWISVLSRATLLEYARRIESHGMEGLPLYGIPFAIKDNIDLAHSPTTAGCPAYAYTPERSAFVVQKLIDAGAIPLGKTNLDQFATGLNGTRSPYGACKNAFDPAYISGGSSSGSAVAVALGLASFSLGTDTAGSGRVPAAFNHIIGLKPSCGRLSTRGVVPACRSLDSVSIFALCSADAHQVMTLAEGLDPADSYSRTVGDRPLPLTHFRFGVPRDDQCRFFGNPDTPGMFQRTQSQLEAMGGIKVEIDFTPFLNAARLLYEGPWLAERTAAVGDFIDAHSDAVHPVVREIIAAGRSPTAVEAFRGQYVLKNLRTIVAAQFEKIDILLTPTAGTIYPIETLLADPLQLNSQLGYYTNFMNLLGLAAVAVPAGFQSNGLPFGVSLCAPAGTDAGLLQLADWLHRQATSHAGTQAPLADISNFAWLHNTVHIAVCGAHLSGLPLNSQLTERGARLVQATRTSPNYRLYALPDGKRPGLVRARNGVAIEIEIWEMPLSHYGSFVAAIRSPLGIGTLTLENGASVQGFLCEADAIDGAQDISATGGWRAYLDSTKT